jgi:hypothetical protein
VTCRPHFELNRFDDMSRSGTEVSPVTRETVNA